MMKSPEQQPDHIYKIREKLEERGLGHWNEEGEWVRDFAVIEGKIVPEPKEQE